ncbi:hypothetical protein LSH36_264g04045 [Paralvinella palmiformis]|uniref:Uncharacterized protein n=1 Tax=Paralvinella palmiformis TaxID=53620 RepID=A0AAD9JKV7_9ANNE|nr:hypothetical protein LSH36_264g04045 [Paralvinella palmiformis]
MAVYFRPTENATHGPFFCNNSSHFNLSSLNPIIGDLLEFWTNLYAEKSAKSFWEHEWYKHGTCATSVSKFNNEYHYFKGTLDLHTKFNLTRFLEERGILPSSVHDYQYTDLLKALQKKTVLSCYHDKTTRVQFLSSIEICLSKSLQWIDCPSSTATMTRKEMMNYRIVHAHPCSDIVPIMYPRMNRV